jgi:hypothetical protein
VQLRHAQPPVHTRGVSDAGTGSARRVGEGLTACDRGVTLSWNMVGAGGSHACPSERPSERPLTFSSPAVLQDGGGARCGGELLHRRAVAPLRAGRRRRRVGAPRGAQQRRSRRRALRRARGRQGRQRTKRLRRCGARRQRGWLQRFGRRAPVVRRPQLFLPGVPTALPPPLLPWSTHARVGRERSPAVPR